MIIQYKNIDFNKIIFLSPKKINNNYYIIPIKYNNNNNIIIQTPKLIIPYGITTFNKKNYIKFIFPTFFTKQHTLFFEFLKKIDIFFKKKTIKYFKKIKNIKKHKYNNILKNFIYSSFNTQYNSDVTIYNKLNQKINIKNINMKNMQSKAICYFSCIWIRNNEYGIVKLCLQLKLYKLNFYFTW